jgi:pimeloyl-ACP methyl ester carboxylesterase
MDNQTTIYFLPGLGADHRLFDEISLPGYRIVHVTLPVPEKGATMESYAKSIANQIDTTGKFILIGVSLGGMISCELDEILRPHKTILISSARNQSEIPALYKLQAKMGTHNLVPGWLLKYSGALLQGIYEPKSWKDRHFFRAMLLVKPAVYFKRTVNMIIQWKRTESNNNIIHIHGTGDRTLPFKLVKRPDYVIPGGSHMMVYTRGKEINKILLELID